MKKKNRLSNNRDFIYVIKNGRKIYSPYFSLFLCKNSEPVTKIGISISKKVSKLAVVRNKLKRQISVVFDQHFDFNKNLKIVLIVKNLILDLNFQEILMQLLILFNKIK